MPFLLKNLPPIRNEQSRHSGVSAQHLLLLYEKTRQPELILGSGLCAAIALLACPFVRGKPVEPLAPILFLAVVAVIAVRFGPGAGTLGTILSAIIFAEFLFEPIHSLAIHDPVERTNLAWLIMGGLAISNFFGRSKKPKERERP